MTLRSFPTRGALSRLQSQKGYRVLGAVEARPTPPSGVACSRDGGWLAVDRQHHTILMETRTGRTIAQLVGVAPLFTPDGALLTCSADMVRRFVPPDVQHSSPGTNAVAGEVFLRTPRGTRANSLALAADGSTLLVCASDKVVLFVDTMNATVRREVEVPAHFAALSADGEHLVTQFHNGAAHLVRLGATNRPSTLGHHLNTGFDPAGRWLAVATEEALRLYGRGTTNRWQQRHKLALAAGVGAPPPFAFSRDGGLLAVVFNRFDVHLYEAETARLLAVLTPAFPAQIGGTAGLAFSADGRELFAVKQDGEVVAWTLPVLRAALAGIGLDWGEPAVPLMAARSRPAPAHLDMWVPAALIAGTSALLAGFVVFALQRRMLAAYERAARMADARQGELVEAQLRLAQSQKMEALGTLAAGIAHDVNNLLSVIRMSNHFVARAVNADQVTRENLDAIERAAQQGRDLVRSMLGYARRADDATTEFNVQRVAGETMGMLSRQFLSGLTVSLELAPDCPPVRGSSARLEQALLNLVINAAEAMQGRGRLNISARVERTARADALAPAPASCHVVLAVTDDGPGIAPENLARIFEPFFTTKTGSAQPGTGLGLSVVYTLARQSGWGLHVASTPGRGAEFQIILPVAEPALDKR